MTTESFKVIIIGGGPVGLIAAHCLYKANIDFVVLERHPQIVKDVGAAVGIGPGPLRVVQQLGFLPQVMEIATILGTKKYFLYDGYKFKTQPDYFGHSLVNHGVGATMFHRAQLIQVVYDALPNDAKAKVFTGKRLEDISQDEHGVKVKCSDGSVYEGHLVLGADGESSMTRRLMRKKALEANPDADWDPEGPFPSSYKLSWFTHHQLPRSAGEFTETQHKDACLMNVVGRDRTWVFAYEKLDKPTTERPKFTQEEAVAFTQKFSDWVIDDGMTIGDALDHASSTIGMTLLGEGVCKKWTQGRMVLAGDAAHKFTPNAGLGLHNGMLDIVLLSNKLRRLVHGSGGDGSSDDKASSGTIPAQSELLKLLTEYEEERFKEIQNDSNMSQHATRWQTWANPLYWFIGRFVIVTAPFYYCIFRYLHSKQMRSFLTLNYIKAEEPWTNRLPWLYPIDGSLK